MEKSAVGRDSKLTTVVVVWLASGVVDIQQGGEYSVGVLDVR